MTKGTDRSQEVSRVGRGSENRLFQQGELRVLIENAKRETQLLSCWPANLEDGGGEQRRENEVRLCRNGGTDSTSCETTMVSNRHYRTLVPWAHTDTFNSTSASCGSLS